jgi:hypothetical protein
MFVLLPWLRSCISLIGYIAAVTANCCQQENGGKIKDIYVFLILIGPNFDESKIVPILSMTGNQ